MGQWGHLVLASFLAIAMILPCVKTSAEGRVVEFDIPDKAGSTHEITAGPDGALWITQQVKARIVRMTAAGEMTFFQLP